MLSRQGFEDALQSPDIQKIATESLTLLRSQGKAKNVAAYDCAIQYILQERRLTYEEYGAVVQLLCSPWLMTNQESSNECCVSMAESTS